MFGFKTIKNIFFGKKEDELQKPNFKTKFHEKLERSFNFFSKKIDDFFNEYSVICEKLKDLYKTNYELGQKHLERGNLKEAIFRFKFVKKFWPDKYEAYYQLAYALILAKRMPEARKVLEELLHKEPSYEPKINELLNSITRIREEYLGNLKQNGD